VSIPQLTRPPRRSRAIVLLSVAAGAAAILLLGIALDRFVLPRDSTGDPIRQPEASAEKARNLLVNGSFEEGPEIPRVGNAYVQLEKDSTALKGWVVSQGNVDVKDSSYWKAAAGKRSLDLNGVTPGAISQTFKTKKGQKYRVNFALAGNPNSGTEKKLQVSAGGMTKEFTFDTTGKTRNDMGWVSKRWEFTAEADKTTLEFLSLTEGPAGPALDDVVVVAIRE
jgi:choice-of-anchor C domain-containing protein